MLQDFEALKTYAYKDSAGIPTIGIGTIIYPDGTPVKMGDKCSIAQANEWARYEAGKKAAALNKMLEGTRPTQNQFDALLLLMYNIGEAGLRNSTLLRRIRSNTGDIRQAWMMWNKARVNGELKEIKGLTNRRAKEADLYFDKY